MSSKKQTSYHTNFGGLAPGKQPLIIADTPLILAGPFWETRWNWRRYP